MVTNGFNYRISLEPVSNLLKLHSVQGIVALVSTHAHSIARAIAAMFVFIQLKQFLEIVP